MSDTKTYASRTEFLAGRCKRRYGELTLPVSDVTVRYRSLSEAEYADFEMRNLRETEEGLRRNDDELRRTRGRLIALCLVDANDDPILHESDIDAVDELDAADTTFLYDRLREHCGLARRVAEAQRRIDALKKNSNGHPDGDSPSS